MTSQTANEDEKSAGSPPNVSADLEDGGGVVAEDKDIAIAIGREHRHAIDPAVEARVVRKID